NSASLLLPVSNLTNLLAFHASGLSFLRFAGLMVLPTAAAVGIEWLVLTRFFADDLRPRRRRRDAIRAAEPAMALPRLPLAVLLATLAGFALSSVAGTEPVWIAVAGAVAITLPALLRRTATPAAIVRSADPAFLVFVLALGVIVGAASRHGLESGMRDVLPDGSGLLDLLAIAAVCALLANAVNNLPAILIALPALAAAAGPGPVLAALIGVNIGPNMTYVGSLATLLWRRALRAEGAEVGLREFTLLGLLTAPAAIAAATAALWLGLHRLA
ncbi:MAG TPA: ArsB/NhaD family transporter, partial [Gaiellales bacterium]